MTHDWQAVAPTAAAVRRPGAAQRVRCIAACGAALLLGCAVLVTVRDGATQHITWSVELLEGNFAVDGTSVLDSAGLEGGPVVRSRSAKLEEEGYTPLLDKSPQANFLRTPIPEKEMYADTSGHGPSGSQQGEQPGHWGGEGSENYGTPLWDNTGWNAHYHPRDGASMDSESMEVG